MNQTFIFESMLLIEKFKPFEVPYSIFCYAMVITNTQLTLISIYQLLVNPAIKNHIFKPFVFHGLLVSWAWITFDMLNQYVSTPGIVYSQGILRVSCLFLVKLK